MQEIKIARITSEIINKMHISTDPLAWIWTSRGTGLTLGLKLKSPISPTPSQSAKSLGKRKGWGDKSLNRSWKNVTPT